MSDSPKYSSVRLSAEVRRQLAAERRRRAEQRRAQRAAEGERRRRERLERRANALRSDVSEAIRSASSFSQTVAGKRASDELAAIGNRLSTIGSICFRDESEVNGALKQLKALAKELALVAARAEAEQLAAEVEQEQAILLQVKRLAAAERPLSLRFDPAGLRDFERQLRAVEASLTRRNVRQAREDILQLRDCYAQHRARVEREQVRIGQLQDEAAAMLDSVQDQLAGLKVDSDVCAWCVSDLEALARRAEQAESLVAAGRLEQVRQECKALMLEAGKLAADAKQSQRRKVDRDYVTNSIRDTMAELGFFVEQYPAEPTGAATIRGTRVDGRAITVNIPLEGQIQWAPDGFPMEVVAANDGNSARACDEAADQIERIQALVNEERGVQSGELTWPGKDPHRPANAARRTSRASAHNTRRIQST